MKVLVPVKRVIDYNVKVRVRTDGSGVDLANVKMSMNPFDEIAVEEALRLREGGIASEIIAVSVGVKKAQLVLRTALAMGADRAIHVVTGDDPHVDVEPLAVAKILHRIVEQEQPGLVLMGKQAIDNDLNATGQMLAGLMACGQATFASELRVEDGHATATREVDGGLQVVQLNLPCVVTVDLRMNEPRYPSLPNIRKARRKPFAVHSPDDFGVDISPRLNILRTVEPPARKAGEILSSVDELVSKLRDEAEVI